MISHLRVHTGFSVVDSTVRLDDLFTAAKDKNVAAIALTDVCNLFAAVKFYKKALASGIKPIFGIELKIDTKANGICDQVFLAENNDGYQNIVNLISKAYQQADRVSGIPIIPKIWLKEANLKNIISLNGGQHGEFGKAILAGDYARAKEIIAENVSLFGIDNYLIEVHKLKYENEELYNKKALEFATKHNLIAVATNLTVFIKPEDYDIHEIRVCINEKTTILDENRKSKFTREQYLKSSQQIYQAFSDLPTLVDNTLAIAKRCNVTFELGKTRLPTIQTPNGLSKKEYFSKICYQGLEKRLKRILANNPNHKHNDVTTIYKNRLQVEVDIICNMGFSGYFLIVEDFIRWAKENDIPVGPGRGSGAGSLVAYSLSITDIDPLPYGLLFERFLNPERVSMPDFDIDFCIQGRDRVIKYVEQKYGRDSVAQIITYGTMAAKGVVRDIVRVMGQSFGFGDRIAKLIPELPGTTFKQILFEGEPLYDEMQVDEDVAEVIEKAQKLESLPRSLGKHAAGIVISPTIISDFAPLYCEDKGSDLITQFDKTDVEDVGLVKFDFLGLKNLTIISNTVKNINAKKSTNQQILEIANISLDDEKTFKLLQLGNTTGIFQLESQRMRQIVKDLGTSSFEEIIALVALYRPGPMENIPAFIDRKHGRKPITYLHPMLEEILKETYGIPVYQEQVMQIAQKLAGYTLGGADLLRRAMGKKKPEEMAVQRKIFKDAALKYNNIDFSLSDEIFDQMQAFAGYGFNKSHAAAYALIAYQTAWLKANYPDQYMAALLSKDMDDTDQLVKFVLECKNIGILVQAPDINTSVYDCIAISEGKIILGLGAIKGLGSEAIKNILANRLENGKFGSLFDICRRVDLRKVNKKALEALCYAGAVDQISTNRATAFNSIKKAIKNASYLDQMSTTGQDDLFGFNSQNNNGGDSELEKDCYCQQWCLKELLINEKKTLGMYFSGHIVDQEIHWRNYAKFNNLEEIQYLNINDCVRIIASMVTPVIRRKTKQGKVLHILNIDDEKQRVSCLINQELFNYIKDNISVDDIVVVDAKVSQDVWRQKTKLNINKVLPIKEYIDQNFSRVKLSLQSANVYTKNLEKILDNLKKNMASVGTHNPKILEIKVSLDNSTSVKFDNLQQPFSIYELINNINALIPDASSVSLF